MTHFGAPFLFILTAIAEIVGCYLPLLWLHGQAKIWVLLPAAGALFAFVWLLTLHSNEAGRTYAAYGCVYLAVALGWLWVVEGIKPTRWDALGVGLAIAGMLVIVYAPRGTAP